MRFILEENDNLYRTIIHANSPWIIDPLRIREPEKFRREAFYRVKEQMFADHEMAVLIKGPRRVGKTEIQKQLIWDLIKNNHVPPSHVLYLTLDDVCFGQTTKNALQICPVARWGVF